MSKNLNKIEYWLHHHKGTSSPWAVRWWPEGRRGKQRNRSFETPSQRGEFIRNNFYHNSFHGKGRKEGDQDREQRENPENWPDELSEVMARVSEIRSTSGRRYSLLSDVYAAMKQLGFKKLK